ncbi:MAG: sensor histidine kinase [Paracoccaceae bacterium]
MDDGMDFDGLDLGAVFDATPYGQVVVTADMRVVAVNRGLSEMTERRPEQVVGRPLFAVFAGNPDDPAADNEANQQAFVTQVIETGRPLEMPIAQHDVQDEDGRYRVRFWRAVTSPIFGDRDAPDRATHALISFEEVTRDVLDQRMTDAKSRAAIRGADVAFFDLDPVVGAVMPSPQLDSMFGVTRDAAETDIQTFLDRIHPDDLPGVTADMERMLRTVGAELQQSYTVVRPDGTERQLIVRGESIRDPDTQDVRVVGIVLDVTEIRRNETRLERALEAQGMLIAEVNHRVKNSLQMVSSILKLEGQRVGDPVARAALDASMARVHAIAAIHASLYEGDDVREVQIDTYLQRLTAHLETSLSAGEGSARIVLDVPPLQLRTDKAITLSLAVNELVTNSFKHAAWGDAAGTVRIALHEIDGGQIALTVTDDGPRPQQAAQAQAEAEAATSGLGHRLIAGLTDQLDGTIEQGWDGGWRSRIVFPR